MAMKLGELLISKKMITRQQLEKALEAQQMSGGKLGTNLIELGMVKDTVLVQVLAEQLRAPAAKLGDFEGIPRTILDLVTAGFAEKHCLIPFKMDQNLHVAISDPGDVAAVDELGFKSGKRVQLVVAPEVWILAALERFYNIARPQRYADVAGGDESIEVTHDLSTDLDMEYEGKFTTARVEIPFPQLVRRYVDASTKEDVFDALLDFLGSYFPRMAVYVNRRDRFSGWIVRGFPTHAREFADIHVPLNSENALNTAFASRREFRGEIVRNRASELGFDLLQISYAQQVRFIPILFRDQVVSVLLAVPDERGRRLSLSDDQMIALAVTRAGKALEAIALKKEILSTPPTTAG